MPQVYTFRNEDVPLARLTVTQGLVRVSGFIAPNGPAGSNGQGATPAQCQDIRMYLKMARRSEAEVLLHYQVDRLEALSEKVAEGLLQRLLELRHGKRA